MSAASTSAQNERKRVKVYELRNNDWFDRGTGFCAGEVAAPDFARLYVTSEDDPQRTLLETRIQKDDGYQKQQDTLIVWTENSGVDMALSFQEPEGCSAIWDFVYDVQQRLMAMGPEELEEDMTGNNGGVMLPNPELGNLQHVEHILRSASQSTPGRDAIAKFVMAPESLYIPKLIPLVDMAEDLEDLPDLHRLCTIMKMLILLNDTTIIEFMVRDEMILGVVGALEYDPDFPSHKANHRQYLASNSQFKEVVRFENLEIQKKIHHTYRLHYLKDVVLARILDDPTFSVLNSSIFYHQVDIVNHIQANMQFLHDLFSVFELSDIGNPRKKDAVLFIQQLCAISKNVQPGMRAQLYSNFIAGGLFDVISFALAHQDPAVRVAGSDILVALIDHDPAIIRNHIFRAINEKSKPLTDTLVELLLVEQDLGVKTQMADAIKVLLDPSSTSSQDQHQKANGDNKKPNQQMQLAPQTDAFIQNFYDDSAKRLFKPLRDLAGRTDLHKMSLQEASLHEHLVGILCFFIRAHGQRSKYFCLKENLHARVGQLMMCPQKHLKLAVIRWLRTCVSLSADEFQVRPLITNRLIEPVLGVVESVFHRDNLLKSACLEFFEAIRRDGSKLLLDHIVETYRDRLLAFGDMPPFVGLLDKYDALNTAPGETLADASFSTQGAETPSHNIINAGQRWAAGLKEISPGEEAYFDAADDDDEQLQTDGATAAKVKILASNGPRSEDGLYGPFKPRRPLVTYADDEDEINTAAMVSDGSPGAAGEALATSDVPPTDVSPKIRTPKSTLASQQQPLESPDPLQEPPPERISEKRRREEDDDDDDDALSNMSTGSTSSKRRNSAGPHHTPTKAPSTAQEHTGPGLRRKGSLRSKDNVAAAKVGVSVSKQSAE